MMDSLSLLETHAPVPGDPRPQLRAFFDTLSPGAGSRMTDDDAPLLGSGVLDSLAILHLTLHLGEAYGIEVGDEEFTLENFETFGKLVAFIGRKTRPSA